MEKQNYKNHVRYYIPHHFVFLPLVTFFMLTGIWKAFTDEAHGLSWTLFAVLCFCLLYLAIMMRQHYALGNQDRIVRLEFRLRYFRLFAKSSEEAEAQLSFAQIAALRFCNDGEFVELLRRALEEGLGADEIKRSIREWKADTMRL